MTNPTTRLFLLLLVGLLIAGCASHPKLIPMPSLYEASAIPLFSDLSPKLQGDKVEVLYATDRQPERNDAGALVGYGSERSTSTALGSAVVEIESKKGEAADSSRPRIELVRVDELVRFPETPYLYRATDQGRIEIDQATALELEQAMTPAFGRVTLYINTQDRALAAAKNLFKSGQRLGSVDLSQLNERQRELVRRADNLDVIAYAGKGGGLFRHGYYEDPAVSADILMLLRYGWAPGEGKRQGLERLGENTWRIDAAHWDDATR